ncbi:IMPACT family protein [Halomonas sp. M20]|uniref:IMPACT family protein n=1 Tax=Halomonas sp. M20 TaxID=2763264 RepID=UPI001D0A5311|nr:YigZ family protein [Halomonas sp. M20]
MRYPIPKLAEADVHVAEIEIERSRFIAWIAHAPNVVGFDTLLARARSAFPDASHHCSAFIAGSPGEQNAIGFSDDGEPGGTAGRPMFHVLEGSGFGQIGCVVTRYFGGTKLGTGGLARAYSQVVQQALETLPSVDFVERRVLRIKVGFAGEAEARAWFAEQDAPIENVDYTSDGVTLTVGWPSDTTIDLAPLEARLKGNIALLD